MPASVNRPLAWAASPSGVNASGQFFPHAELLASAYGSDENMEGIRTFLDRRSPDFLAARGLVD